MKLICSECGCDEFGKLNPDEDYCLQCGEIHENLSDYDLKEETK